VVRWSKSSYSVEEAYLNHVCDDSRDSQAVWNGVAPLKVSFGCGRKEHVSHLFFKCTLAAEV